MPSRALRILLLTACICSFAATAIFVRSLDSRVIARRTSLHEFDRLARESADALADLRAAQHAYLAFGQDADLWTAKVDETTQRLTGIVATLQPAATGAPSKSAVDDAIAAVTEFGNVDARVRGYLQASEQLMAADVVFSEGDESAMKAGRHIEQARIEEHLAFDLFEAEQRRLEIAAAGASAGVVLLLGTILALVPRQSHLDGAAPLSLSLNAPRGHQPSNDASSSIRDLPLRDEGRTELNPHEVAGPAPDPPDQAIAAALQSVALICTDIGRVEDPEGLVRLLSRAADVLDASGLVLWVGTASGTELRPALAHGYSAEMVSRIPTVLRSANNAAAAAYRSGSLQVVPSRSDSPSKGAVVAPVLSADGCVGVLSAEIRNGGETSATVQSLATIFAAQLAGVVASTAAEPERRATGSGPV